MSYKWNQNRGSYSNQQRQSGNQYGQGGAHFPPTGLKFLSNRGGAGILGAAPVGLLAQRPNQRPINHNRDQHHRRGGHNNRRSPPRDRDRNKDSRKRRRESSHDRSSPDYRRGYSTDNQKAAPKYLVRYVRKTLNSQLAGVQCLKSSHPNIYIPSDFVNVNFDWLQSFSPEQPLRPRKCQFHIMSKEAQFLDQNYQAVLSQPDSDHSWVAKVMLLNIPSIDDIYERCCMLSGDEVGHFHHQMRLYKFLIGSKGKKEVMAIGGPWSPSLDGPDPDSNPRTLINTAIRNCKALTGIDLTNCTNWRRMVEIQYHRDEEVRKGHTVPDRVETTVIFLPDVHSCMPTAEEYNVLRKQYLDTSDTVIEAAERELQKKSEPAVDVASDAQTTIATADDSSNNDTDQKVKDNTAGNLDASTDNDSSIVEPMETAENENGDPKPMNAKTLKVSELRKELEARGLSSRGLKGALVQRLTEALEKAETGDESTTNDDEPAKAEDTKDEAKQPSDSSDGKINADTEEKSEDSTAQQKEKEEDCTTEDKEKPTVDKEKIQKIWTLPEAEPIIPVHPNPQYKKGGFECVLTPLSTLLEYKQEDNKESIFEVSIFAESFKQMLQRDHALNIYKALCNPLPKIVDDIEEENIDEKENEKDKEEPDLKKAKVENGEADKASEEKDDACPEEEDKTTSPEESEEKMDQSADDATSVDDKDKEKKEIKASIKKVDEKMVTLKKDLLLSFAFFDTTQCGYIRSTDLTAIIHSIGLGLSRSQIKKLLSYHLENDELKYRKLTDVPVSLLQQYEELAGNFTSDELPAWNKAHLLRSTVARNVTPAKEADGMVTYNGVVIDVKALHMRLEKNEGSMAGMEMTIQQMNKNLAGVTDELDKTKVEKCALQSEYDAVKEKLTSTESKLQSETDTRARYEKTLRSISCSTEEVLPKVEKSEVEERKE